MVRSGLPLVVAALIVVAVVGKRDLPDSQKFEEHPDKPLISSNVFPFGEIDVDAVKQARAQLMQLRTIQAQRARGALSEPVWVQRGPNKIQGRVTAIAVDPIDDSIAYVAAAEGGVFKTTDAGDTWVPVFDDQPSMAIGSITLDPSDRNTVYVGTGEANPSSDSFPGTGLYKSTDGGNTWANIGLENSGRIGRIIVHPTNPNIIHVAVSGYVWSPGPDRGIYRTSNGGATWTRVLFIDEQTGAIDIVQRSDNPNVLFAAMWEHYRRPGERQTGGPGSGVHKSTDGGLTWSLIENGLPPSGDNVGRIGLSISKTNPDVMVYVYAQTSGPLGGVYRTTDGGNSWTQTNDASIGNVHASFGWWFGNIRISPFDENTFWVVGFSVERSTDGGLSYQNTSSGMHVDHHAMAFGGSSTSRIYAGNDGGVYTSTDGGSSFIKTTGDLPITQAYRVAAADWNDNALWLGTQDNGTSQDLDGDGVFDHIYGGDGFEVVPHLTDPDRLWAQSQWGGVGFSANGGNSFSGATSGLFGRTNWDAAHAVDPSDPETRYFGTHFIFRNDGNRNWVQISDDLTDGDQSISTRFGTITTIGVSPADSDVIWAGADDGNVHVTQDYGETWTKVSTTLPQRWVSSVRPHPSKAGEALVALSGFQWGEDITHLYRTIDFGQSWMSVGGDLPDIPLSDVMYDPKNTSRYFVATDLGVFQSFNGGQNWSLFGTGMPAVAVDDFAYRKNTRELIAGTHGRSILTISIPEVFAESLIVTKGVLANGDFENLGSSDNVDVSIRRGNTVQPVVEAIVSGTSPVEQPSELAVVFESSVFARTAVTQSLGLFNYVTDQFEVVDSRSASRFTDQRTEVVLGGDVSRFIQPGSGQIEMKFEFIGDNPRLRFTANIDQSYIHIVE